MLKSKWFKTVGTLALAGVLAASVAVGSVSAGLAKGSKLGNIIASQVPNNFSPYWNQVTPENSTKWGAVEGTRNVMNWGQADMAYNYAKNNGFPFKFHTLVWGVRRLTGLTAFLPQIREPKCFNGSELRDSVIPNRSLLM